MTTSQKQTAIVLLGLSGAGKDTIANELCRQYPVYRNIKFAVIVKHLLADWLGLDDEDLENKKLRSEYNFNVRGYHTLTTVLDLLDVIFRGCPGTTLETDKFCYAKYRCEGYSPIFTDCRSVAEAEWIKYNYEPICIRIYTPFLSIGISDDNLDAVCDNFRLSGVSCHKIQRHKCHNLNHTVNVVKAIINAFAIKKMRYVAT